MKISFLSFYSGKVDRGVETFVFELSNSLVSLGHNVDVFQSGQEIKNGKFRTIKIDSSNTSVPKFTQQVLKRIDPDTDIVFPTNGRWQSLLCKIWALKNGKKMIVSGQSGPGFDDRLNLLSFPDCFVALTNYQAKWARHINPAVKIEKISNGVDLNKFGRKISPIKTNLSQPIVLCVGALEQNKRTDLVIKAVSRIKDVSLLLVGRGENENNLRKLAHQLLPGRFEIQAFPHDVMPQVYTVADVATFATNSSESFGIVIIEALASGLPVVLTDDPIRREIAEQAGSFVDVENPTLYSEAIMKALKTKRSDIYRKQAEKFSWNKIALDYEKLFKSLLAK